jgi:beta-glucosidase
MTAPTQFLWGVATAAYQIEGAAEEEGRGESIWDRFVHTPGKVVGRHTGDVACDHYHRWREDVDLMRRLGVNAYRFSVAWPRVLPEGRGAVNQAGIGFYDRLVDALLEAGITPFLTLYHWDLPQALQDGGGWVARSTVEAFTDYTAVVAERLGDRVSHWATINEPWVVAQLGHALGVHAPGLTEPRAGWAAAHHLLLAHGRAVRVLREAVPDAEVGIVLNLSPVVARSAHPADVAAATLTDGTHNRWFLDPLAGRGYPEDAVAQVGWDRSEVLNGDLETVAAPLDFLGVNYYFRLIESAPGDFPRPQPVVEERPEHTDMGWEVYPEGLGDVLRRLHTEYPFPRLYVTENGAAYPEPDQVAGPIDDRERTSYLARHIQAALEAAEDGAPLSGYFVWTLLDNFEWAYGYTKRFGLVHVDHSTGTRTPKASFDWYRNLIA